MSDLPTRFAEAQEMIRFAAALGCSLEQVKAMTVHLSPWLGHVG